MLHTTVVPTMLRAGNKINVIPNSAEAQLDVRRMPTETREEVIARFKQVINDPAVDIALAPGQQMPAAEPSSMTTPLYHAMERAVARVYPHDVVVPYMARESTDGSFLRSHGMAVYGVPVFVREGRRQPGARQRRAHLSAKLGGRRGIVMADGARNRGRRLVRSGCAAASSRLSRARKRANPELLNESPGQSIKRRSIDETLPRVALFVPQNHNHVFGNAGQSAAFPS